MTDASKIWNALQDVFENTTANKELLAATVTVLITDKAGSGRMMTFMFPQEVVGHVDTETEK